MAKRTRAGICLFSNPPLSHLLRIPMQSARMVLMHCIALQSLLTPELSDIDCANNGCPSPSYHLSVSLPFHAAAHHNVYRHSLRKYILCSKPGSTLTCFDGIVVSCLRVTYVCVRRLETCVWSFLSVDVGG